MFKRKKIHSELDAYIHRRYEDLAVCIHYDVKNGRGTYNYYAPWLEAMLQRLPSVQLREKYSLMTRTPQHQLQKASTAWGEHLGAELRTSGQGGRIVGGSRISETILENVEDDGKEECGQGLTEGNDQSAHGTTLGPVTRDYQLVHKEGTGGPSRNQTVIITGQSRICIVL